MTRPNLGDIIIVRTATGDAPGIVSGNRARNGSIDAHVFPANSTSYSVGSLYEIGEVDMDNRDAHGWFWPPVKLPEG